jgi:hypothetical protein
MRGGTMTRKDYELIAKVFAEVDTCSDGAAEVVEELAHALANALADDNPRFDRARFLAACRVAP